MRVIGIDPGLTRLGYGVVDSSAGRIRCLAWGTLATPTNAGAAERLLLLSRALAEVMGTWQPEEAAVERVFYNRNVRTAVPVIQAAGVALLAAAEAGAGVFEYTPLEVKQAVAGTGAATKGQVAFMVEHLLGPAGGPQGPDAADALAIAICHVHSRRMRALGVVR